MNGGFFPLEGGMYAHTRWLWFSSKTYPFLMKCCLIVLQFDFVSIQNYTFPNII